MPTRPTTSRARSSQVRLQPIVQQNVVTYATVIDVPNPELKLKPGMTANVNIEIASAHQRAARAECGAAVPADQRHLRGARPDAAGSGASCVARPAADAAGPAEPPDRQAGRRDRDRRAGASAAPSAPRRQPSRRPTAPRPQREPARADGGRRRPPRTAAPARRRRRRRARRPWRLAASGCRTCRPRSASGCWRGCARAASIRRAGERGGTRARATWPRPRRPRRPTRGAAARRSGRAPRSAATGALPHESGGHDNRRALRSPAARRERRAACGCTWTTSSSPFASASASPTARTRELIEGDLQEGAEVVTNVIDRQPRRGRPATGGFPGFGQPRSRRLPGRRFPAAVAAAAAAVGGSGRITTRRTPCHPS